MQNVRVVWLDANLDETKDNFRNSLNELGTISNHISTFIDADQCIDFMTDTKSEKIFMIVSAAFGENLVPNIYDLPQINAIAIFSNQEERTQQCLNVIGNFTEIQAICKVLHQLMNQSEQDIISMSFITADSKETFITTKHYDQMDKCFIDMYLLKDVAFEMDNNDTTKSVKALGTYARQLYANDPVQLQKIIKFEREFNHHTLLWWYTNDYFLFSMLNQALRTVDVELIIRMAFIFRRLNHQIGQLYQQQTLYHQIPFTVYRVQTLTEETFQNLQHTKGGLLVFNSFLLANTDQQTAMASLCKSSQSINIIFIIKINSMLNIKPFAILDNEKEVLFCMYTVFRIGEIEQKHKENSQLWFVHLTLIPNNDSTLVALDNRIRQEIYHTSGWEQTGRLLMQADEHDKVEKFYELLVNETSNIVQKSKYSSALGEAYGNAKKFEKAIAAYQYTIDIVKKIDPSNYISLAILYNNIGVQHSKADEFLEALVFYKKALDICKNYLPPNSVIFSQTYNNMGNAYLYMKKWSTALFYLEKALEIHQKTFSSTDPQVRNCKRNIKRAKEEMLDEEKKKNMEDTHTLSDYLTSNGDRTKWRCEDEFSIFGRNHFSIYINELNKQVRYALYWLDINTHNQKDLEAELCHIIPLMERYDDAKECETEIKNAMNFTIVLIVNASMVMQFIPLIHDCTCLTKVFIHSTDGSSSLDFEELMKSYKKITAVVSTERDLIEKISEDWEDKEKRSIRLFGTVDHWDVTLESRKSSMLWFKLLISFLIRFQNTNNNAKKDLIDFMRLSYQGNAKQLENIDIFEREYRATDAISWYTRDFCLYRLVNKAFRLGNINSLFSLRLFIQDLYAQLRSLHTEQRRIRCETKQPIIRSFRGQIMLRSGVVLFSPDEYVIVNSFFSTSTDRQLALGFLVGGVASSDQELVFFIINAKMSLQTMPFADISTVSNSTHEKEVLYAPGSLFRIKSKRFDSFDDVWIVELDLCDEEEFPLKAIYDSFNIKHKNDISLCDFSMLLNNMGEYKKAEKFLFRLLNEQTMADNNFAEYYHALGRVAYNLDDYDRAVSYYETVLDKQMQMATKNCLSLAYIYNDLAMGYCKLKKIDLAIDSNESAIKFSSQIEDVHQQYTLLGNCYHTAGKIYFMQQQYDAALQSLKDALDSRQECYPPDHPFITKIYLSMGMVYFEIEKHSEALQMFNTALNQFLKIFPLTHSWIGDTLYHLANTELKMSIRSDINKPSEDLNPYFHEAYNTYQHSLRAKSFRFLRARKVLEKYAEDLAKQYGTKTKGVLIPTPAFILF